MVLLDLRRVISAMARSLTGVRGSLSAAMRRCEAAGDTMTDATLRPALAGLCASLVGIGLARFAYTPLIPALIDARWFLPGEAAYLGAANLAGYLAGALLAGRLARRLPTT